MTGLSRVLGLVRDIVLARLFGAGTGMDAFIVAFRIPNFFRRLFAEGAFTQAFVPVLAEYRAQRSDGEVQSLLDQVATSLSLILLGFTVLGILAAPVLIFVFAPGFGGDEAKQASAAGMLRITFPYLLFISLTALAAGILNTWQRFAVPAFTPVLLNLSLIACAIWLSPHTAQPVEALAWGVCMAGMLQLAFQFPFLRRLGKLPRLRLNRDRKGGVRVLRLLLPVLFASSIMQINLLVDTFMASFLETGSISWLYYSDRLVQFPLGVFGVSLATVILPSLAREHSSGQAERFAKTLDWGLRWVFLVAVPASVGLVWLAEPILVTLFRHQAFNHRDAIMAAGSLAAYAWGLTGFILVKILAAGFFSRQEMALPVKAATIAMVVNIVCNILLIFPLAHIGLALATSVSACVQAAILYYLLCRDQGLVLQAGWGRFLAQVSAATLVMSVLLWYLTAATGDWEALSAVRRVVLLALLVATGKLSYCAVLWVAGLRPRSMLLRP